MLSIAQIQSNDEINWINFKQDVITVLVETYLSMFMLSKRSVNGLFPVCTLRVNSIFILKGQFPQNISDLSVIIYVEQRPHGQQT